MGPPVVSLVPTARPTASLVYTGVYTDFSVRLVLFPAVHLVMVNGVTARTSCGIEPSGRHLALGRKLIPAGTPPEPWTRDHFVHHLPWQLWVPVALGAACAFPCF